MENAIDVIISISGLQDARTPDNIEFVTCGKYSYEKNFIRISYMESELTGLEGTQTTITITPEGGDYIIGFTGLESEEILENIAE